MGEAYLVQNFAPAAAGPALGTQENPASGAVALEAANITDNGLYWLDIGDGRGATQYYCVFDYPGGPYVMVAQNMWQQTGNTATFGIQNTGDPANGNIGSSTHFNSNIASVSTNILAEAYMVTNTTGAIFYTNLDTNSRNAIYGELRDTSGETSASSAAYTGFTSPGGAIFSNKTTQVTSWGSTGSVIELHHAGWNSANVLNFIIEIGRTSRAPGNGGDTSLRGFDVSGARIFSLGTIYGSSDNSSIDYHFIKI